LAKAEQVKSGIGSRFGLVKKNINVMHHAIPGEISPKFFLEKFGGERGIRTPQFPADNKGNPHDDAQIDSQFPVASSPELSQVVTAWTKLPVALKAAILAIVKSAE
jgi:hypothetical protein